MHELSAATHHLEFCEPTAPAGQAFRLIAVGFCCRPSHVGLVAEIVDNLRPPPHVAALAERIVANLTAERGGFNGLHLRIEDDTDWVDGSGGADVRAGQ